MEMGEEVQMRCVVTNLSLRPGTSIKTNLNSKVPDIKVK